MEQPQLLAHQTDLITYREESRIEDKGRYWKYSTPDRPRYFWGNFLLFKTSPTAADFEYWIKLYHGEFEVEEQRFITFSWDDLLVGDVSSFLTHGFEYIKCNVLLLDTLLKPQRLHREIEIREMREDWEWEQFVELHDQGPPYTVDFLTSQMQAFRAMVAKGLAIRYGAFIGKKLVGDCGVLFEGDLLRYNSVATHHEFRRQGICCSLVYEVTRRVLEMKRFSRLVMLADAGEPAEGIYLSLGFRQKETVHQLQKYWN